MRLLFTSDVSDHVFSLEVGEDIELAVLKALCESESGIPGQEMSLIFNNTSLDGDSRLIGSFGLKDNDMVLVRRRQSNSSRSPSRSVPGPSQASMDDPRVLREMFLANPEQRALLNQSNPPLAKALESSDPEEFNKVFREQMRVRQEEERRRMMMLTADPFDPTAQQMIAEEIRRKNVDANMEQALEHNPESFGTVVMLYVDCVVNKHHVKAFVDTGAQTTLMSAECADRCGIKRLIDTRWSGIAKGVGTQRITGRIHMVQIEIAGCFLASSFSILEDQPMDMLLGLDMLKRHQCIVDLNRNVLIIGTTGKETRFLNENELPPCARMSGPAAAAEATSADDEALAKALAASAEEAASKQSPFPEKDIKEVMNAGCNRQQALDELTKAKGDPKVAIIAVLTRGFSSGTSKK
ncbi:unnamed protein product [Notodromas monacha]|uniref:Ubiquitin-like domain-containing protein n=1 Tax=Notodromas monacha TaxID=399045 RepID=A0A7R9GF35_9CRUS|nr:unnamed protein product [Notodromas monacha]CAG0918922.1 unnamed protein product [Notodromas monacha]